MSNNIFNILGKSMVNADESIKKGVISGLENAWKDCACHEVDILNFIEGYTAQSIGKETYLYPLVIILNPDCFDDEYIPEFDSKSKSYCHNSFLKGLNMVEEILIEN